MPISVPSLKDLLTNPTVILLGAGASADYGFPMWEDLKNRILDLCNDADFRSSCDSSSIDYWIGKLESETNQSVDSIAAEANDAENLLFRKMVGRILISCEADHKRSGQPGWVEAFCKKLLALPMRGGDIELIENLGFINLNYDR